MNTGEATYTTREKDFDGHFDGDFADMKVMPAHLLPKWLLRQRYGCRKN